MLQNAKLNLRRVLLALRIRIAALAGRRATAGGALHQNQFMRVTKLLLLEAVRAHVKIVANLARVASSDDVLLAAVACVHKRVTIGVMQMVQDHHTGMFGSTQLIELVAISLAQTEEVFSSIENGAFHERVWIVRLGANHGNLQLHVSQRNRE